MNQLLVPEGPNPIAFVVADFQKKQTGFVGDYNINNTDFVTKHYANIYTLGDLYTQLALADQDVITLLEQGTEKDVSRDSAIYTATEQATVVFGSRWSGLRTLSLSHRVSRQERRSPRSWIDEAVSTFEAEQPKTTMRRKRIAGSIGYII